MSKTRCEVEPSGRLVGYCPMGCGQTLFVGSGGQLLDDRETEHVVTFRPGDFTIRHPLRERRGDELMTCALHSWVADLMGPPAAPGRYRVTRSDRGWSWERLDQAQGDTDGTDYSDDELGLDAGEAADRG